MVRLAVVRFPAADPVRGRDLRRADPFHLVSGQSFPSGERTGKTVAFPASRSVHRPRDYNTVSASSGLEGQDRSSPF